MDLCGHLAVFTFEVDIEALLQFVNCSIISAVSGT